MRKLHILLSLIAVLCCAAVACAMADGSEYVRTVYNMTDLLDVYQGAAYTLETEFVIHFDRSAESLFRSVCNDVDMRNELATYGGIYNATWHPDYENLTITIYPKAYYPGVRIAWAWANGDSSRLTADERKTLDIAQKIVDQCWSSSDIYRYLYDALCKWGITYVSSSAGEKIEAGESGYKEAVFYESDTAVGALLNKKADCDGFADAFYLLVTMTGGNARHMDVKNETHEVCQVQMDDGYWYIFDACWDNGGTRKYYAMTESQAIKTYGETWHRELFRGVLK